MKREAGITSLAVSASAQAFPAADRMLPYDADGYPEISVPDLGRVFQTIRDGNCIPFFGAGASMAYAFNGASAPGLPSGWEMTLALLREAHIATDAQIAAFNDPARADPDALRDAMKLRGYDLFKAADSFLYSRANNRGELDRFLRREVAKANSPRPIHTVIAQLEDIYTVLTTNYDCLFETACETYQREVFKHVHEQFKANTVNAQVGAKKGGAKFGDELLRRMCVIAEPVPEDARQAGRVA